MTKEQLFEKYSIDISHSKWEPVDSWNSVEIFRLMNNGRLPDENDTSILYCKEFLDKSKSKWWVEKVMIRTDWGSLYLTAKRMIHQFSERILEELTINK